MFLFDSDVIIDFLRKKEPGFSLVSDFLKKKIFISITSWVEIVYGIEKSKGQYKDFDNFLDTFSITILPIDKTVAKEFICIKLILEKERKLLDNFDLLIAGTALAYNLTLVTRNIKHFSRIKNLKLFQKHLS